MDCAGLISTHSPVGISLVSVNELSTHVVTRSESVSSSRGQCHHMFGSGGGGAAGGEGVKLPL